MTFHVTLGRRGQFTLPKALREALGVTPGSRLALSQLSDGTVVLRVKHRKLVDLAGILTRAGQPSVSIEQMGR
jgi:AbrB family looped-hinge helix DNA binding protein